MEIFMIDVHRLDSQLQSPVRHLAFIPVERTDLSSRRQGNIDQQISGILIVTIEGHVEPTIEE